MSKWKPEDPGGTPIDETIDLGGEKGGSTGDGPPPFGNVVGWQQQVVAFLTSDTVQKAFREFLDAVKPPPVNPPPQQQPKPPGWTKAADAAVVSHQQLKGTLG